MIKISFTGDIMCEHTRLPDYYDGEHDLYSFGEVFKDNKSLFSMSDYVVGNLETPLAGKEAQYSYRPYQFNTPEEIVAALKDNGFTMLTTANNHALDRGIEGLKNTIQNLKKYEIDFTGTATSLADRWPLIKKFGNAKVSFLSYTYGTEACYNRYYIKRNEYYYVNLFRNQELHNAIIRFVLRSPSFCARACRFVYKRVKPYGRNGFFTPIEEREEFGAFQRKKLDEDIAFCKENSDFVVLCLHSGGQFNDNPVPYTERIIQHCRLKGVDLVVCNHEHVIQSSRQYEDGSFVTYCLGNFSTEFGITCEPYDKLANCSIVLHAYLDDSNDKIVANYSFSVCISHRNESGLIVTTPLYDLYKDEKDKKKRDELVAINTSCIKRFCEINCEKILPEEEFFIDALLERKDEKV